MSQWIYSFLFWDGKWVKVNIFLKHLNYIYFTESQTLTHCIWLQSGIFASLVSLRISENFNANRFERTNNPYSDTGFFPKDKQALVFGNKIHNIVQKMINFFQLLQLSRLCATFVLHCRKGARSRDGDIMLSYSATDQHWGLSSSAITSLICRHPVELLGRGIGLTRDLYFYNDYN
jgi:hypothetical protein